MSAMSVLSLLSVCYQTAIIIAGTMVPAYRGHSVPIGTIIGHLYVNRAGISIDDLPDHILHIGG